MLNNDDNQAQLSVDTNYEDKYQCNDTPNIAIHAQKSTGRQAWMSSQDGDLRDNHACVNKFKRQEQADIILAEILLQSWSTSQNRDAVMLRENEATAIDCHQYSATLKPRVPIYADSQYKGTIQPNLTATEANAGQMSSSIDASSGFGSDGNRLSYSLTKDSRE